MGCACLFGLLAAGAPRVALVLMWLFTPWVNRAFGPSILLPLLGLIFLPLTTVMYILVSPAGIWGFEWLLLFVAVVIDLGAYGSGAYGRRR